MVQESTRKTSTPVATFEGGPAGLEESFAEAPEQSAPADQDPATSNETDKQYTYGTTTTHRIEDAPVLQKLSVSLTLDSSLEEQNEAIAEQVKAAVGFQTERGDQMATHTTALNGIERDEEGQPVAAAPVEVPETPNPMLGMLLERGVEITALLIFVFLLLRSLRASKKAAAATQAASEASTNPGGITDADLEIDPTLLARKHIEHLLENDPDRVSSLLSRWAMGEDFYAKAQSGSQ